MVSLPTSRADWRLLGRTLRLVLGIPGYAALALLMSALGLTVFVFSQNLAFVEFALTGPLSLADRIDSLLRLYPFLGNFFELPTELMLVGVSLLVGANIAMVVYHFREHGFGVAESGGSAVGVFLGVLGAGCAACGSAILVGVLSLFGATGLLTVLPLEGQEFSLIAGLFLVLSMYWLADGMRGGEVRGCPIDPP